MSLIPADEAESRGRGDDDTVGDSSESLVVRTFNRAMSWVADGWRATRRFLAARDSGPVKTVTARRRRERFESDDSPRRVVTAVDTSGQEDGRSADIRVETGGNRLFTEPPAEDNEGNRPLAVGEIDDGKLTVQEPGDDETAITSDVWEGVER